MSNEATEHKSPSVEGWLMWNHLTVGFSQPITYVGFASTDATNCGLKILKKKKKNSDTSKKQPWIWSTLSLVAQTVKNPPAMQKTWVQTLSRKDPLEKETATHSCLEIPRTSGLQSTGL